MIRKMGVIVLRDISNRLLTKAVGLFCRFNSLWIRRLSRLNYKYQVEINMKQSQTLQMENNKQIPLLKRQNQTTLQGC